MGPGQKILYIALAGALGTLSRYGMSIWMHKWTGNAPWGTVAVNLIGCFLFGLIVGLGEGELGLHPEWRAILLIGFAGAFTTFSTFIFDSSVLWTANGWYLCLLNLSGQVVTGFIALAAGLGLAKALY